MLLLVEAAAGLESLHQDSHLLQLSEGQVGDDAQQALQDAGVGAHKGSVDLVQQHHQLVLIARQQQVTLGGGGEDDWDSAALALFVYSSPLEPRSAFISWINKLCYLSNPGG